MKYASFLLLLLLLSCSDKLEIKKEYQLLSSEYDAYRTKYDLLQQMSMEIREISQDKSMGPDYQGKVRKMDELQKGICEEAFQLVLSIEKLKEKLLEGAGIYHKKHTTEDVFLELSEEKHFWTNPSVSLEDYPDEVEAISQGIRKFRASSIKKICEYHNRQTPEVHFSFRDPGILSFEDEEKHLVKLNKALTDVAPDDEWVFRTFYLELSKRNVFADEQIRLLQQDQSLLSMLALLTEAQTKIIGGSHALVQNIRYYTGCCEDYAIDKIIVMVDGPSAVTQGDSVKLRLLYAFYNSDRTPFVHFKKGNKERMNIRFDEGFVELGFKAEKDLELGGTLTMLNKSGVPKTMNWHKSIRVFN